MTRLGFFVSAALTTLALAAGYFLGGEQQIGLAAVAAGLLWISAYLLDQAWVTPLVVLLFSAAAALGVRLDLSAPLMIAGIVFAVLAWDLAAFARRLRFASEEDDTAPLEKGHLVWAVGVAITGFLLSLFAGVLRLQLSFWWVLALAMLGTAGFIFLVSKVVPKS